ncbi:MAG TPA: peptidoglycan bridge formation protein FemAB, partial [Alphaproteobacteria bacterium]|nr:peptidoglycan bridge formation protein FemAB [Alphaproteobacteria bacterium]
MATAGHDLAPSAAARAGTASLGVERLAAGDERSWDEYVRAAPRGTFFHLAGWKRVIERAFGHATYYLAARQAGRIVGVLPLTHVRSRLFGNALIANAFCVYGGPLAESEAALLALDAEALRIMGQLNARYLEYRTIAPLHQDWPRKGGLYVTFRRPLAAAVEANLKAIPRKQRAMVRKGM